MDLKKLLPESLLIIFSVLFALFINEYRTNANEEKQTKIMLENVKKELKENHDIFTYYSEYHENCGKRIDSLYKTKNLEEHFFGNYGFQIFNGMPRGIIQDNISTVAWDIARQNDITSRIDLDQATAIFRCYDQIKTIDNTIDGILDMINSFEVQQKKNLRTSVIMLVEQVQELQAQEDYFLWISDHTAKKMNWDFEDKNDQKE